MIIGSNDKMIIERVAQDYKRIESSWVSTQFYHWTWAQWAVNIKFEFELDLKFESSRTWARAYLSLKIKKYYILFFKK